MSVQQPSAKRKQWVWLWLSFIIIIADQIAKYFAVHHLSEQQPLILLSWLDLVLVHNTGASFGFLNQASGWQCGLFTGIAIVISVFIVIWFSRLGAKETWTAVSLSLILGGALGNLIDRIHYGFVIDFIDFHLRQWHWPVFNIADAAISIGALLLILSMFFQKKENY